MTDPSAPRPQATPPPLEAMLDDIAASVGNRQAVLFGEMLDTLGRRGFGPVLTLASGLTLLPTGMVPMVPAIMGAIMLTTCIQMLRGRREIWLPPWFYRRQIPGPVILHALDRARPTALRLDRMIRPHLVWLARSRLVAWAVALVVAVTSLAIIAIGAIPGLPFLLAIHPLLFGIGLTTGDGRFVAAGFAVFLPAAWGALWLAGLV